MSWVPISFVVIASSGLFQFGETNVLYPGQSLVLNSPNYPNRYPVQYACSWGFSSPTTVNFTLQCNNFNVYLSEGCSLDFIEVQRADLTKIRYCGYGRVSHSIVSNAFNVVFRSNSGYKKFKHMYTNPYMFSCTVTATQATSSPTATTTATATTTTTTTTTTPVSTTVSPVVATPVVSSNTSNPTTNSTKCACGIKNTPARIVGGQDASMNEYPYQCMLTTNTGSQYCGCSLLCQKYVLTASHCVDGSVASSITVVLGDYQKNITTETQSVKVPVKSIKMHPGYDKDTIDNDIAILELAKPVNYSYAISPVCLPCGMENVNISGLTGTVTGWGTTSSGGTDSAILKEVSLPLLTSEGCKKYYGTSITNNMICTYEAGKDSCQGDSGGPLVMQNKDGCMVQMGVVSWGVGCAVANKPGVYCKISNYIDWIRANTASCDVCLI